MNNADSKDDRPVFVTRRSAIGLIAAAPVVASALLREPAQAQELSSASSALDAGSISVAGETKRVGTQGRKSKPSVSYRTYVRSDGWQKWKAEAKTSGTSDKSKDLVAFEMKVNVGSLSGHVKYRVRVAGKGWLGWCGDGATAGDMSHRIESVRVKLTGELAERYDVYYRVRARHYGWLDWASNGTVAGNGGLSVRVMAVQVKLVKKGAKAPGATLTPSFADQWKAVEFRHRDDAGVKHILEVKYLSGSLARVALKKKSGKKWKTVLKCRGFVGSKGIGKAREGLARTPQGDFGVTSAFGIKADPGAKMSYVQVTDSMYWCADRQSYNQLIDINENPHACSGEHLIDYAPHYNYGLFFDYNTNPVVYGAGAAFFVHCTGGTPYMAGCVAVSEKNMIEIVRTITPGARLCIYPE